VANALSGLENVLSALQLLLLYVMTAVAGPQPSKRQSFLIGLIFGWMLLTRPDGALFALVLLGCYLLIIVLNAHREGIGFLKTMKHYLPHLALFVLTTLIVLVPWYLYQWSATGKVVTDSSIARLYSGRQGSIQLGPLFFNPKATISLAVAFLPLAAGALLFSTNLLWRLIRSSKRTADFVEFYSQIAAVLLLISGYLFYSFVVGAESFGRYFLPLYPFLFLTGLAGLALIFNWFRLRSNWLASAFAVSIILFLTFVSSYDYYRRLGPGRFNPHHILDVIYGPAHLQYYSPNLFDLVNAPARRQKHTNEFLTSLGAADQLVSIAVTEVQLRYFLDDRVNVLSLDGRTSANTLSYFDVQTGVPDFERFFLTTQPDFVHVNQWCTVGGWLAAFRPAVMEENLVCQWEQQIEQMAIGEQFTWQGREATLIAPEIVGINWSE